MSSVSFTSNGWSSFNLDFDRSNLREHLVKGAASGITSMTIKSMSEKGLLGTEMAQRDHAASEFTSDGLASLCADAGNAFAMKTLSGGLNSMLMTATYSAMDGKGFKNDYSRMNWGNMTMSVNELGNFFGSQANTFVKNYGKQIDEIDKSSNSRTRVDSRDGVDGISQEKPGWFDRGIQVLSHFIQWSEQKDKVVKGYLEGIGSGAVKMASNLIESTVNVVSGYGFSSNETLTDMAKAKGMTLQQFKDWVDYTNEMERKGIVVGDTKKIDVKDEYALAVQYNLKHISDNRKHTEELTKIMNSPNDAMMKVLGYDSSERSEWGQKLGIELSNERLLDVRLIGQQNKKDCVLSSLLMAIEYKLGDTIDPRQFRKMAVEKGIVTDKGFVKDANSLAKLAGLKDEALQKFRGSGDDLLRSMLYQLEKGNPVMILLPGPDGGLGHMETAIGYKFDKSGELKIILNDPGYQKDKYLDPKTMQPYKVIRDGVPAYSGIYDGIKKVSERRMVYGFNYYEREKNK